MPTKKGQKVKEYAYETKIEAIRLHVVESWTYRKIMEKFGITDRHRLKAWMRKYREYGRALPLCYPKYGRGTKEN